MKLLNKKRTFEDNNGLQYFLNDHMIIYNIIELKDKIIIIYSDKRKKKDLRPIYCFSKKDASILWQVQYPIINDIQLDENYSISHRSFYIKDNVNGRKKYLFNSDYEERMGMVWYLKDKYINPITRLIVFNKEGELKEFVEDEDPNLYLANLNEKEKYALFDDIRRSFIRFFYSKLNEEFNEDIHKIICKVIYINEDDDKDKDDVNCFLDPNTGMLREIIEGVD